MLTFTEIAGTPFQVGLALGRQTAQAMHDLGETAQWHALMQWRSSEQSCAMQALVQERHPYIWDELQGLARGLELPAEDVFLWNCRGDLLETGHEGGTTILQPGPDGPRISHNVDGPAAFDGHCGLAELRYEPGPSCAAFIAPGTLPGNAFAVTDSGLVMVATTIHTPVQARQSVAGLPRLVLTRALLSCNEIGQAIALLQTGPRAGGAHIGLAHRGAATLLSVEFTHDQVSIQALDNACLHADHLVHEALQALPQHISDSSRYRQIEGTALLTRPDADDALAILANRDNPDFPLYRSAAEDSLTLATADIRVSTDAVTWDVHRRPHDPPCFRMRDHRHL
ncbi:MAG: C45 family peptidase [Castellaniella sp.]